MAAGNTYVAIFTETLASAQASVTFSVIPSTYTDLVLVCIGKMVSGSDANQAITFNGDSSALYSRTFMYGDGTNPFSGRATGTTSLGFPYWNSTNPVTTITQIMNYSNTTTFKTAISRNAGSNTVTGEVGLYRSTSAISSITLTGTVNFAAGSTFSLYGIKAA
jgi:hypothetical protein